MLDRHEALRTCVVMSESGPTQVIAPRTDFCLRTKDMTSPSLKACEDTVQRCIEALILEPIRADQGPLLGVELVKLGDEEHVLIVVLEHMISDAYSMNVFLRDLLRLYVMASGEASAELPDMPMQLADFAVWQSKTHSG